jgi:hypothetical protein
MKPVGLTQRQRDQVARGHGMMMRRALPILAPIILASCSLSDPLPT